MGWTDDISQLADNFAEIQAAVGKQINRVEGEASLGLLDLIRKGEFDPVRYAKNHSRGFGGQWKVEVVPKYPDNPAADRWLIIATRTGG